MDIALVHITSWAHLLCSCQRWAPLC